MAFVWAFLIGGVICAIGQLFKECRIPNPIALVIFIILGGVLTPIGLMGFLSSLGAGGVCLFACGFGNAAYNTGAALAAGSPAGIIMVALLLVILIALGAACGVKKKLKPPEMDEKEQK